MARNRRLLGLIIALMSLCCGAGARPSEAAGCPSSRLYFNGLVIAQGAAAARETTLTDSLFMADLPYEPFFVGLGQATYDLVDRHFSAWVDSENSLYVGGVAVENYVIVGLPPGEPVALTVRLCLLGRQSYDVQCASSGCTPQSHGAVYGEPDESSIELYVEVRWPGHTLPVERRVEASRVYQRTAGIPFRLQYEWWAGTSHTPSPDYS
jgi:hypothetical protein